MTELNDIRKRWDANWKEAIAAWREATGQHNVTPDLGALLEWLLGYREHAEKLAEALMESQAFMFARCEPGGWLHRVIDEQNEALAAYRYYTKVAPEATTTKEWKMTELNDIRKQTEGHTPGPWSIEGHGMADALYAGRDDQHHGLNLCSLSNWDMNSEANSRLIAAAPDLLQIAIEQESELAQLRTERERLLEYLGRIRPLAKSIALISAADQDAKDMADSIWEISIAALTKQEGEEDE